MSTLSKGIKIGLTGAIASGKSTALDVFKSLGFFTFSADEAVKTLYEDQSFLQQLEEYIPHIRVNGAIDKAKLISALQDEGLYQSVIKCIHEGVLQKMLRFHKEHASFNTVCEVPLLFEVGWQSYFDETWVISLSDVLSLQRAMQRGMSPQLYAFLKGKQWDITQKCALADVIIGNEGSKEAFIKQIQKTIKERL